jgi:hypothetical protein
MMRNRLLGLFLGFVLLAAFVGAAFAQAPYAPPTISVVDRGLYRLTIGVTAGADGAPSGYGIQWMKKADYDALGGTWPDVGHAKLMYCECYGPFTLNSWDVEGNPGNSPILEAGQTSHLQLGDLNDEEGLYGAPASYYDPLTPGTQYVVRGYTLGDGLGDPSAFTSTLETQTLVSECTQGFWKTHGPGACHSGNNADVWPAACFPMELGTKNDAGSYNYNQTEICSIFLQNTGGNGLISLAHQLATAKLNGCSTSDLTPVAATMAAAQALIGNLVVPPVGGGFLAPASTSELTETLDDYNNGLLGGVANCPTETLSRTTWGRVKVLYR